MSNIKTKPEPKWLKMLKVFLGVATVAGFVPWERLFLFEITDPTLFHVYQVLGTTSLALLLGCFLATLFFYNKVYNFFIVVLLSFAFVITGFICVINIWLPTPQWQDVRIYKNKNDYIIIEQVNYGLLGEFGVYRLIETQSPRDKIRTLKRIENLTYSEGLNWLAEKNTVEYTGKLWLKRTWID
jgi:hypothetical protein